eukprot:3900011-Amphidinium_carterae.1
MGRVSTSLGGSQLGESNSTPGSSVLRCSRLNSTAGGVKLSTMAMKSALRLPSVFAFANLLAESIKRNRMRTVPIWDWLEEARCRDKLCADETVTSEVCGTKGASEKTLHKLWPPNSPVHMPDLDTSRTAR